MLRIPLTIFLFSLFCQPTLLLSDEPLTVEERFFETQVRPLLVEHCFECHSEQDPKGGLRLDDIGALLTGGESGPALVEYKPEESLLLEAVRYESYEMPPSGQLPPHQIAILEQWIKMGAPWPQGNRTPRSHNATKITDEDRQFWSFQPLQQVTPPVITDDWIRNDIDKFILRRLAEHELRPRPEVDRRTLIRRLTFDLIGLPPTPDQVARFVANSSPTAYEELVDELLASPQHGERWASFWLDLVRYADSDGFRKDDYRAEAWKYRDYVINSFNADKPFHQFIIEQLAGDELPVDDPQALIATGFLRHGIYEYNQRDARTQWQDMLNDITDTVGDTFLGLGMGCARCHDHKFDPILQKDYYRLQAFFANISLQDETPAATHVEREAYEQQLSKWEAATAEIRAELDALEGPKLAELAQAMIKKFPEDIQEIMAKPVEDRSSYERQIAQLVQYQIDDSYTTLSNKMKGGDKKRWEKLKEELAKFDDLKPTPLPKARTVCDYAVDAPAVYIPSKERLGAIEPGFLTIFTPESAKISPLPEIPEETSSHSGAAADTSTRSGRRLTLARWLARDDHPLTTRVIVNRIWKEHFGAGIVSTLSDFGHLGEKPSHPELLDWLATEFVNHDWSLKWLHREIVLSATYRQASALDAPEPARQLDPENRWLWHFPVKRLSAEQIRDAMLAVSGELIDRRGGPGVDGQTSLRRSIYIKVMRNRRDEMLDVFDFPDRITSAGGRNITTTPGQALQLINGDWMLKRAAALGSLMEEATRGGSPESLMRELLLRTFGREPAPEEQQLLAEFIAANPLSRTPTRLTAMPQTDSTALEVADVEHALPLQLDPQAPLPVNQWTVQARVVLRQLYPSATVRTIVSHWDNNTQHPGWALGVTSEKSKYTPRNLILQIVGLNAEGKRTYEVIPSGLHLELNHPYRIGVSVNLEDTSEAGISFVVEDLINHEIRTAQIAHQVIQAENNPEPLILGGRANSNTHRWHGWLDDILIMSEPTPLAELRQPQAPSPLKSPADPQHQLLASWNFEAHDHPLRDTLHGWQLSNTEHRSEVPFALIDLCHTLLNCNEFLYID